MCVYIYILYIYILCVYVNTYMYVYMYTFVYMYITRFTIPCLYVDSVYVFGFMFLCFVFMLCFVFSFCFDMNLLACFVNYCVHSVVEFKLICFSSFF